MLIIVLNYSNIVQTVSNKWKYRCTSKGTLRTCKTRPNMLAVSLFCLSLNHTSSPELPWPVVSSAISLIVPRGSDSSLWGTPDIRPVSDSRYEWGDTDVSVVESGGEVAVGVSRASKLSVFSSLFCFSGASSMMGDQDKPVIPLNLVAILDSVKLKYYCSYGLISISSSKYNCCKKSTFWSFEFKMCLGRGVDRIQHQKVRIRISHFWEDFVFLMLDPPTLYFNNVLKNLCIPKRAVTSSLAMSGSCSIADSVDFPSLLRTAIRSSRSCSSPSFTGSSGTI